MKRLFAVSIISLFALAALVHAQERRFTIDDLLKVRRVADPQVSPKGNLVAFTITDVDKVANKSTTQIYLVPLGGGEVVGLGQVGFRHGAAPYLKTRVSFFSSPGSIWPGLV